MRLWDCGCIGNDCDCIPVGPIGLGAMGDVAPGGIPSTGNVIVDVATDGWTATVKHFFDAAWSQIESFLGIGDGRREADLIVPLQNAIGTRLAEIVAAYPSADSGALRAMYAELQTMGREFQAFVSDPRFTDGRASAQALADIIPLIEDNKKKIAARIASFGGTLSEQIFTSPYTQQVYTMTAGLGGSMDTTTMIMLGLGALFLLKGKIL